MKFDVPAGLNAIDRERVIGHPVDRIDGPLKTTGRATYAYEHDDLLSGQAYGYIVGASIAKGRLVSLDVAAAKAAPGVIAVVSTLDMPRLGRGRANVAFLFGGGDIQHYGQAVAIVVAESFEAARAAAFLIDARYEAAKGAFDLAAAVRDPGAADALKMPPPVEIGDFETAFSKAEIQFEQEYRTPDHSHAMMEPHATLAHWQGDKLTVWTSNQMIHWGKEDLAATLRIAPDNVRLIAPFIGGGFGGKLFVRADVVLGALGAKASGRPVKVALTRPLIFNNTTHRAATIQTIRIGATRGGKITAIGHHSASGNLAGGKPEAAVDQTRLLYAGEHRLTGQDLFELDLPEANSMRAPGEASGLMALEIAMDEAAEKIGIDPVAFRIMNDTQVDPEHPQKPFSYRDLVGCLRQGADRFGWSRRHAKPGSVREGRWLVGMGVAAGFRNNLLRPSGARVSLDHRGMVTVETDMTDIGTGSYTIIAQTAAEMMGVPLHQVSVRLGDSSFPASSGSGGQWGAANSTAGVYAACVKLRDMIADSQGFARPSVVFADGYVQSGNRRVALGDAASGGLSAEDTIEYGDFASRRQQSTFAAHFVEAVVDACTGEIRVRRMLAVCSAGRILNPKTARSQVIGAMTMGLGAALMEGLVVDTRTGFFVNHDLASYEVPVHADVPHQDVVFLEETDPYATPLKAKGVGELGLCGVAAAIANAVYNATGVRVRDYPVTLDKFLDKLPPTA